MNKEEIISQIPQLRKELDTLVHNFSYLQTNINFLKGFAKSHNIHSKEEMENFLLNCDLQTKKQLIEATKNISSPFTQWPNMPLEYMLKQAESSVSYKNIQDDINFIKDFIEKRNISLEKTFREVCSIEVNNDTKEKTDLRFIQIYSNIAIAVDFELKEDFTPSELLVNALVEVPNRHFNQSHNYSEHFLCITGRDFCSTFWKLELRNFITDRLETKQDFELPIIIARGKHFEPGVIQYKENTLSLFHIGDEDIVSEFLVEITKDLNIPINSHFIENVWQHDSVSCFNFAINYLEYMVEDLHHNNVTLHQDRVSNIIGFEGDRPIIVSDNNLDHIKFSEKDLKYFAYTQSLSTIQKAINYIESIESLSSDSKNDNKLSDIIKNAPITVQEVNNKPQAKAMNFAIYESAYKFYSETQEMFNSYTDEEIADIIISHQLPITENSIISLAGESTLTFVEAA
jgi:hypothetical protein